MNKEQSNQMFGLDNIDAWLDDISVSRDFVMGGSARAAVSLLSDVQEDLAIGAHGACERARTSLNRTKYLLDLSPEDELTRRIVSKLMRYLGSKGFDVVAVVDEEERYETSDPAVAMGHIFAVGEASLRVWREGGGSEHGILLIPSNGEDIISDWNYSVDDADGFENAMKNFEPPEA